MYISVMPKIVAMACYVIPYDSMPYHTTITQIILGIVVVILSHTTNYDYVTVGIVGVCMLYSLSIVLQTSSGTCIEYYYTTVH